MSMKTLRVMPMLSMMPMVMMMMLLMMMPMVIMVLIMMLLMMMVIIVLVMMMIMMMIIIQIRLSDQKYFFQNYEIKNNLIKILEVFSSLSGGIINLFFETYS